jgi:hypothetical protein
MGKGKVRGYQQTGMRIVQSRRIGGSDTEHEAAMIVGHWLISVEKAKTAVMVTPWRTISMPVIDGMLANSTRSAGFFREHLSGSVNSSKRGRLGTVHDVEVPFYLFP